MFLELDLILLVNKNNYLLRIPKVVILQEDFFGQLNIIRFFFKRSIVEF